MKNKTTVSLSLLVLMFAAVFTGIPIAMGDWPMEFEQFGPHADQLLIKMYSNEQVEFSALELGEIDLVDWSLTKYWIDRWAGNPEINMMEYGSDLGAFQIDINNNETKPQSGPAGAIPGTQEDNIGRNMAFRHAVAHLTDRAYVISTIVQGFGVPMYTMVPPAMGAWLNPDVDKHLYSPFEAADILARGEDGILGTVDDIKDNNGDGYYDWPGTDNRIEIDFVVRDDHTPGRREIGDRVIWELTNNIKSYSGGVGFKVDRWSAWGSAGAENWVMKGKSFTLYTGGWVLDRDVDYLFTLYDSNMCWQPDSPNYNNIIDAELDAYLEGIYYASTFADAMPNTQEAQRVMAEKVFVIPIYAASAPKAGRVHYTGGTNGVPVTPDDGENIYRSKAWKGFADQYGFGLNSWWSFLDAHAEGYEVPEAGNPMVLRYGFRVPEVQMLNPIYSEWYWDWEVLGKTYDTLLAVNPFDLSDDLEWVAKSWEVRLWTVPETGEEATKIKFHLRNDVYFHDGEQLTSADVKFMFSDLPDLLNARGLPPPWWYSDVLEIHHIETPDPYTVIVYEWVRSYWALHQLGELPILPEHIWRPIVTAGDPTVFAPDSRIVGSGQFMAYPHSIDKWDNDYYVPYQYVRLDAFKPNIISPGYFNLNPVRASAAIHGSHVSVYVQNYWLSGSVTVKVNVQVGANDLGDQTVSVPPASPPGNVPRVTILNFDASSIPRAVYWVTVTLDILSPPWLWDPLPLVFKALVPSVQGDTDNNGVVNVIDGQHLQFHWGLHSWVWPEDDINEDNAINVLDALHLLVNWGAGKMELPIPAGPTTISVEPYLSTGTKDDTISVDINITNAADICSYEFRLWFNASLLTPISVTIGDFFPTPPGYYVWKNEVGTNYVRLAVTRPWPPPWLSGITGSGRLATIQFTVIGLGTDWLHLSETYLADQFPGQSIVPYTTEDGIFSTGKTAYIDIKPASWPNPIDLLKRGVLPIAICGTGDFDVRTINVTTIKLTRQGVSVGVSPVRWDYEDVATPWTGEPGGGHALGGDGYLDLSLKFSAQEVRTKLGLDAFQGQTIPLIITGKLNDAAGGTPFSGQDYIWILTLPSSSKIGQCYER